MKHAKKTSALVSAAGLASLLFLSCEQTETITTTDNNTDTNLENCDDVTRVVDLNTRGACSETLAWTNEVSIRVEGSSRIISTNSIPDHMVGLFGGGVGSLNPNAISPQNETYTVSSNPVKSNVLTYMLNTATGPQYEFGVMLNGVILDPEAAEPWPHNGAFTMSSRNWEWNLDAMNINLGLDCNNAHVQPSGKYHHHGAPTLFLESINAPNNAMTLLGYAADGFPIYYNYGYTVADDPASGVVQLTSSYRLKSGERPGDGINAPCGAYSGIYTSDYEYIEGFGVLDECNGREGVTPEYPEGTYYYVLTQDSYPYVPRCVVGTPSNDFRLGA
ncbi:MAG: YHYH protein [Bacteroidota bacterium]